MSVEPMERKWTKYQSQTLSFIITLKKVISAIFDQNFLKFGTLMVALLDVDLIAISVEDRQYRY